MSAKPLIYTVCFVIFLQYCLAEFHVWPSPKHLSIFQNDDPLSISKDFRFVLKSKHSYSDVRTKSIARIKDGISRMNNVLMTKNMNFGSEEGNGALKSLHIHVVSRSDHDDYPSSKTRYDYNITIKDNVAEAYASSQYGALYAMETFVQ